MQVNWLRRVRWARLLAVVHLLAALAVFVVVVWDTPARNGLIFLSTAAIFFLFDRDDEDEA